MTDAYAAIIYDFPDAIDEAHWISGKHSIPLCLQANAIGLLKTSQYLGSELIASLSWY